MRSDGAASLRRDLCIFAGNAAPRRDLLHDFTSSPSARADRLDGPRKPAVQCLDTGACAKIEIRMRHTDILPLDLRTRIVGTSLNRQCRQQGNREILWLHRHGSC